MLNRQRGRAAQAPGARPGRAGSQHRTGHSRVKVGNSLRIGALYVIFVRTKIARVTRDMIWSAALAPGATRRSAPSAPQSNSRRGCHMTSPGRTREVAVRPLPLRPFGHCFPLQHSQAPWVPARSRAGCTCTWSWCRCCWAASPTRRRRSCSTRGGSSRRSASTSASAWSSGTPRRGHASPTHLRS